jgi:hypothetical protein
VEQVNSAASSGDHLFALFRLLRNVRQLEATDPRDKIFGVVGLSTNFEAIIPAPDYSQSPAELFTEVTIRFLKLSKSLYFLIEACTSDDSSKEYPSWVTDWSRPPILDFSVSLAKRFRADRGSKCTYKVSADRKELRVKGVRVDSVDRTQLAAIEAYRYGRVPIRERIPGWQASCAAASTLQSYATGETVQEALWRTLSWNVEATDRHSAPMETSQVFESWHRAIMSDLANGEERPPPNQFYFSRRVNSTAPVCVTLKGFLTSVPYTTQAGDCIAVLAGGRVPFVLRPTRDHYRLIGPCYVHGIMNGEAFPEDDDDLEWFSIR